MTRPKPAPRRRSSRATPAIRKRPLAALGGIAIAALMSLSAFATSFAPGHGTIRSDNNPPGVEGEIAEGTILAVDTRSGTVPITASRHLPVSATANVDLRGNVVGAQSTTQAVATDPTGEFEALSCFAHLQLPRACPTVTPPMAATSDQDGSNRDSQTMLQSATRVTEVQQ